jgi:hypothetical protein
MRRLFRHRFTVGAAALLLAGGAGGAYAASQSTRDPQQTLLNDVAKRLHVTPAQLRAAIRGAFLDRLQADVKVGRITQAQANRIRQQIEHGGLPFGPGGLWPHGFERHRFGIRGFAPPPLAAAAHYLGVTPGQLLRDMQGGKSLADVARAESKSVAGLERAMVAAERVRLDRLVAAGWITKVEARRRLNALSSQIGNVVEQTPPHVGAPGPGPIGVAPGAGPVPGQGPGPFGAPPGA